MTPPLSRAPGLLVLALTACAVAACAPAAPASNAGSATGTSPGTAAAQFPVTVRNCGRDVTIPQRPARVVGMEGAAETLFALGAADQVAGYFGAAPEKLPADLAAGARQTTHLGKSFPFPAPEQVLAKNPDLVVLYGSGDSGNLVKQLDAQKIPYLQLSESCDKPDHTVQGYFGDVQTIATALGRAEEGSKLVGQWKAKLPAPATPPANAPKVVVYGNMDPAKPFVSGSGSFVQDQLTYAGGINAYADQDKGYLTPTWEDIASRKPDIIFSGGGGGEETRKGIENYLTGNAALAQMPAVKNKQIINLDYAKNVPGPQAIQGILEIRDAVKNAKTGS